MSYYAPEVCAIISPPSQHYFLPYFHVVVGYFHRRGHARLRCSFIMPPHMSRHDAAYYATPPAMLAPLLRVAHAVGMRRCYVASAENAPRA